MFWVLSFNNWANYVKSSGRPAPLGTMGPQHWADKHVLTAGNNLVLLWPIGKTYPCIATVNNTNVVRRCTMESHMKKSGRGEAVVGERLGKYCTQLPGSGPSGISWLMTASMTFSLAKKSPILPLVECLMTASVIRVYCGETNEQFWKNPSTGVGLLSAYIVRGHVPQYISHYFSKVSCGLSYKCGGHWKKSNMTPVWSCSWWRSFATPHPIPPLVISRLVLSCLFWPATTLLAYAKTSIQTAFN